MDSIIISTKDNVSKFTYIDNEWNIETLYKRDNTYNEKIIKKTLDIEAFKAEVKCNVLLDKGNDEQPPTETDNLDKNIVILKPVVKSKPKARVSKPRKKLVEIENKIEVE